MAKVDLKVTGGADLAKVGRRLREVGDKGLQRELARGIQRATKPMKEAGRRAAAAEFPQRGGLAQHVAASKFTTRTRKAGKSPGARVTVSSDVDMVELDAGTVRHPVYGNRSVWVMQRVPAQVISGAMEGAAPEVRREIDKVLSDVTRKLEAR